MTTAIERRLPRTLFAAVLALTGTFASFAITTTPAHAAARSYQATLASALDAPAKEVVNGVLWHCEGASCSGPVDGASPARSCANVAKAFGPITAFATPKGEFSAQQLERCNAAA